eukprot:CAMPEP_0181298562 /NCGR_PEP_ID=MMETSP1101-20121128/5851_1 /TAXON_ID=46948 /ORGANISM="Rhodomonas abbreviata, Strain Caron Lab Isolate" /LENGTH=405 /DNA_ID=CAMNT_0023403597 /DNA_START=35 /DNA_END=1252 /DNA_ORIENTATION=+
MAAAIHAHVLLLLVFVVVTTAFSPHLSIHPSLIRSSPLLGPRVGPSLPAVPTSRRTALRPIAASFSSEAFHGVKYLVKKFLPAVLFFLLITSVRIVPPATVGIVQTFGTVAERTISSGPHLVSPFATIKKFNTKTQLFEQQNHVPTKEGLTVDLDVAVLFRIDTARVRDVYLSLGEKYVDVILKPELSSAVRSLTSESEAKALYSEGRTEIQKRLQSELTDVLAPRGIIVENVLLKAVTLPQQLTNAIELKAQAEQESARMEFVLAKEKQEAERKKIEAKGISDFQKIVSEGISGDLLKWKGVEATEKLADSPNTKIVIVGNSKDSLPIMLSADPSEEATHAASHQLRNHPSGTMYFPESSPYFAESPVAIVFVAKFEKNQPTAAWLKSFSQSKSSASMRVHEDA